MVCIVVGTAVLFADTGWPLAGCPSPFASYPSQWGELIVVSLFGFDIDAVGPRLLRFEA